MIKVATMNTTISRVYPDCLRRRMFWYREIHRLTRSGGFLQSQCGAAARRNFFDFRRRIRESNDAETAHECVPFAGNDHILVVGRRKEGAPMGPAGSLTYPKYFASTVNGGGPGGGPGATFTGSLDGGGAGGGGNVALKILRWTPLYSSARKRFRISSAQRGIVHIRGGKSGIQGDGLGRIRRRNSSGEIERCRQDDQQDAEDDDLSST